MRTTGRRAVALAFGATLLAGALAACGATSGASQTPSGTSGTSGSAAATSSAAASPSEGATTVPEPSTSSAPTPSASPAGPFTLTSPAFADGAAIPKANTCDGEDRSPELRWANAPSGTAALVLEMVDPDAHDWVHWLVFDVPGASTGSIAANVGTGSGAPPQGRNSFGKVGWGGPCPPSGTHHYVFTLFALDAPLGLSGSPDRAAIDKAMAAHRVLGKATLTGTYRRG
jgi:Raf kinase inhibitor-like YbhB/YbcL family protein